MSAPCAPTDLAVLVADGTMGRVIDSVLRRGLGHVGVRQVTYTVVTSPKMDPGVLLGGHELLRPLLRTHCFAAAVFDHHGCGAENKLSSEKAAAQVQGLLEHNGWKDRAKAVCIAPEFERWLICTQARLAHVLGRDPAWVCRVLAQSGHQPDMDGKFREPKVVWETLLREAGKRQSAALYASLAAGLPLDRCTDPALCELLEFLRDRFPA